MAICKNGHKISLLVEGYPRIGFQTFSKVINSGSKGICITRLHPDYVSEKYGLSACKRYWLSGCKGMDVLSPKMLGHITKVIKASIAEERNRVVFMDGLEYLLLYNDLAKVLAFLNEVDTILSKFESEMVVSIDPLTFENKDLEKLFASYPRCGPEEMMMTLLTPQPQQSVSASPESAGQTI